MSRATPACDTVTVPGARPDRSEYRNVTQARPRVFAGVPTLIAVPETSDFPTPVVIWYHGLHADALAHAAELERCAAAGFLAIGVDVVGHGARRDANLAEWLSQSPDGGLSVMLSLVEQTVLELPAMLDEIEETFPINRDRVSLVGISMGAFLVYRAVVDGPPIRAIVALLGSPEWPSSESPHLSLARFRDVAVLSITAEHDASVSPAAAQRLHEALQRLPDSDSAKPEHHHMLRGAAHGLSAMEWTRAMRVTMQWLKRWG